MKPLLPQLKLVLILITLFCTVASSVTNAQAKTWRGITSDWNTASNWAPAGVPTSANAVTIPAVGGAVLFAPQLSANGACGAIIFSGSSVISNTTGSQTLTAGVSITTNAGFTTTISCPLILSAATTFGFVSATSNLTVSGVISGAFGITKAGAGTLTLSGLNSYSGSTTISAGMLKIGAASSGLNSPLGTAAGSTIVANGGVLDLNGFDILTGEALNLTGTNTLAGGALINSPAILSNYNGNVTSATSTAINVSNAVINLLGNISITGTLNKLGAGILNLGSGTVSIGTLIMSGTVNAGNDIVISTKLTINPSSSFLNMSSFILSGIFSTGVGSGELRTSNISSTPIPGNNFWNCPVIFNNPAGGQTIVGGAYAGGLNLTNISGTQTASGNILNLPSFDMPDNTTFNMAGFNLDGGINSLSMVSGAVLDMGVGNLTFGSYAAMLGTVRFSAANNGIAMPAGTADYYGSSQTVISGAYDNLIINESAGNAILDVSGTVTVSGLLTLSSGTLNIGTNTLVIDGGVTRTGGNLGGDATSNLVLSGTSGNAKSLYFDAAAAALGNLILSHTTTTTTTLFTDLSIFGGITFGSSSDILDINAQHVTLKSDINGTAYIGDILGTLTGATNITAERFIGTSKRAWRLLTIPVTGQTIRNAWAGVPANPDATPPNLEIPGIGTLITGNGYSSGTIAAAAGFDWFTGLGSSTTSSIRFYNAITNNFSSPNTPDPLSLPTEQGYMLYVRGDRTIADATSFGTTTLAPTGTLKQGTVTVPVTSAYPVVGNPYASSLDIDAVYNNGGNSAVINRNFYVWDATQGTSGAYNTINYAGPGLGYTSSITGGDGAPYLIVNSGQAFFVQQNGGGTLSISEANKTTAAPQIAFRPMGTTGTGVSSLAIKLYQAVGNTLGNQSDGVVARYNNIYNVAPTEIYDAAKFNNFNENLGLVRNNRYLSIESRPFPTQNDTLFVPFWNLVLRDYALTITSQQFAGIGQAARLIDAFTNTQTVVDLNDATITYPFSVTSNPASSSLNRFTIVFTPTAPLPVTFTKINATLNSGKVQVTWSTGSELGVKNYDVEKSTDGSRFGKIGIVVALNSASGASYQLLDEKPVNGNNFYRIRSNDENGKFMYSNTAVLQLNGKKGIQVTPTVINNQRFTLSLNDLPAGKYGLLLTNSTGQQVYQKMISNTGGNNTQQVAFGNTFIATGIYNLTVSDAKGNKQNFRLVIKN